jgi:hypothetical protein
MKSYIKKHKKDFSPSSKSKESSMSKQVYRLRDSDKSRIVSMVKKDMSTDQIKKKLFNQYSRQQIAAVRAWVTMGKY